MQYALIFLLAFTSLYIAFYFDIRGFFLVLLLLAAMNLPSLLVIVALYYLDSNKKWSIPNWFFSLAALVVFVPTFLWYDSAMDDPRNLFPIFEEPKSIIFLLCLIAHAIAWICVLMIEKIKMKFFTKS